MQNLGTIYMYKMYKYMTEPWLQGSLSGNTIIDI